MRLTDARISLVALVIVGAAVGGAPGARAQAQEQPVDPYADIIDRAAILDLTDWRPWPTSRNSSRMRPARPWSWSSCPVRARLRSGCSSSRSIDSEPVFFGSRASQAMLLVDIEGQQQTELDFFWGNTGHFALDASIGLSGRMPPSRFDCVRTNAIAPQLADRNWGATVLVAAIRSAADGISRAIAGLPWIDPMALLGLVVGTVRERCQTHPVRSRRELHVRGIARAAKRRQALHIRDGDLCPVGLHPRS